MIVNGRLVERATSRSALATGRCTAPAGALSSGFPDGRATRVALAEHARGQGIEAVVVRRSRACRAGSRSASNAAPTRWVWPAASLLGWSRPPPSARTSVRLHPEPGRATTARWTSDSLGAMCWSRSARPRPGGTRIDVGMVNGRLDLNKSRSGPYADAVPHRLYRDAKLRTLSTATAARPPRCSRRSRPADQADRDADGHERQAGFGGAPRRLRRRCGDRGPGRTSVTRRVEVE